MEAGEVDAVLRGRVPRSMMRGGAVWGSIQCQSWMGSALDKIGGKGRYYDKDNRKKMISLHYPYVVYLITQIVPPNQMLLPSHLLPSCPSDFCQNNLQVLDYHPEPKTFDQNESE